MSDNRILFISQEIAPYLNGSEYAEFNRNLAQNAHSHKFEVRTFMPKYGTVNERRNQLHEVIRLSGLNIPIDDNDHPLIIKVASLQPSRIQVYFIDNDDFFQKETSDTDPAGSNRSDNDERAIFFARGTMETVKKLRWVPKIIVCSGWMTALNPLYMRTMCSDEATFKDAKMVYIITDETISVPVDSRMLEKIKLDGVPKKKVDTFKNEALDTDLFHLLAINNADAVVIAAENVSDKVKELIAKRKLPTLEYKKDEDIDKIFEFYKSLISE